MTTFYISPSSLSFSKYAKIHAAASSFGWSASWNWRREAFYPDAIINQTTITRVMRALARTDVFIALVPGTCSTSIEIGMAYTLCESIFLAARAPVYFKQTGLSDAHMSALPNIKRVCCEFEDIPAMLKKEYSNLIDII